MKNTYSQGWPEEYWWPNKGAWFLYDDTKGNTYLKFPYWPGTIVPCPACGQPLVISNYKAECCGRQFRTGQTECSQVGPYGQHTRKTGRGWDSLRLCPDVPLEPRA